LPECLVLCTGMNGSLNPLSPQTVSQFVIPAKSRKAGREPGSRKSMIIPNFHWIPDLARIAWIFHELLSRDREDGRACPPSRAYSLRRGGRATHSAGACAACLATVPRHRGIGSEAYLSSTSQGTTPEDARLPARRAYSSERRTSISVVVVTPGRDEISGLEM
jgi:hypothetical protein